MRPTNELQMDPQALEALRKTEKQKGVSPIEKHTYLVNSNLGTFTSNYFPEALSFARKIFTVHGSWALIETV